jgi:hypothetical protein
MTLLSYIGEGLSFNARFFFFLVGMYVGQFCNCMKCPRTCKYGVLVWTCQEHDTLWELILNNTLFGVGRHSNNYSSSIIRIRNSIKNSIALMTIQGCYALVCTNLFSSVVDMQDSSGFCRACVCFLAWKEEPVLVFVSLTKTLKKSREVHTEFVRVLHCLYILPR